MTRNDLPKAVQDSLRDAGLTRSFCEAIVGLQPEHQMHTLMLGVTQHMRITLNDAWLDREVPTCTLQDFLLICAR